MSGLRRLLLTAGTAAALTTCGPVAAQAFTDNLIVNTTLDAGHTDNPHYCTEDGEEGGTVCPLRAALELAQQTIGGAGTEIRVLVPAGTYLLNGFKGPLPLGNTGTSACGEAGGKFKCPVTLEGAGATRTIIDGQKSTSLIGVLTKAGAVTVAGVTLTHGSTPGFGGAISSLETPLTVRNSVLSENVAAKAGGAIETDETQLQVINSSIRNNSAETGGGIDAHISSFVLLDSSVTGNHAVSMRGGGIALEQNLGDETIIGNSTIAANTAALTGGGINDEGFGGVSLIYSTLSGNSAGVEGGGIRKPNPFLLEYSIIAGNSPDQCVGATAATAVGTNIVFGPSSCVLPGTPPLTSDPKLGGLSPNGGLGETIPLLRGSPALDAGGPACPSIEFAGPVTDERGVFRPRGAGCDLGAYESAADAGVSVSATPNPVGLNGSLTVRALAANSGADVLTGVSVSIPVPAGTTLLSAPPGCTIAAAKTSVSCSAGTMAPGQTAAFAITVRPEQPGTLLETAAVTAEEPDFNPANDAATAISVVGGPSAAASSALVGRVLSFTARGVVTVRVHCTSSGASCSDGLAIYGPRGVLPATAARARKPAKATLLARGHLSVAAGKTSTIHLHLTRTGLKLARKHRSFQARLLLSLRPATGAVTSHRYAVTLKRATVKRHH